MSAAGGAKRRRSVAEEAQAMAAAVAAATAAATAAAEAKAAAAAAALSAAREKDFMCSICTDLLNAPATTPCGHNFCSSCIKTWLAAKPTCPLCTAPVPAAPPLAVNKVLEAAIEANAGPLFCAQQAAKAARFYAALVALDPAAALAEHAASIDVARFVGDAAARMTPLLWACANAKGDKDAAWLALAKALIARPDVDLKALSADGRSALSHATSTWHIPSIAALVPLLHSKGVCDAKALGLATRCTWTCFDLSTPYYAPIVAALNLLANDDTILALSQADRSALLSNVLRNGFDAAAAALISKGFRMAPASDALRYAASGGCAAAIKLLCTAPAPLVAVDTKFDQQQTALHIACCSGRAAAALTLLECGASVYSSDAYKVSPMIYARRFSGMDAVVVVLKAKGATF